MSGRFWLQKAGILGENGRMRTPANPAHRGPTPEERREHARRGGLAASRRMTPAQKTDRARAGGLAGSARLTPEQRKERAKAAVNARWKARETS